MLDDFSFIFSWWFLFFGLGLIFLPLTWLVFKNFFDIGYGFTKIIAILLISYGVWLAGSLKILPFSIFSIWLIILILAFSNFFLARKFRKEFLKQIKTCWKIIVLEEIFFFLALTSWSFIRGFQPDIEGLEKFMDFGFVNSLLRSDYFPPQDMWFAGQTINYYYFGHLVTAVLTKLSGIDSAITYNLMIATIFALAFTATFSLASNLIFHLKLETRNSKLVIIGGLLSALLLTLGGNLHSLWWFLTHNLSFENYWYPDATRFIVEKFGAIDNTIHEFPIYSFVVSDLHSHVSNIPFVLLFLGLIFARLISRNDLRFTIYDLLPLSLVLAVMYMTNAWDFPIYFMVLCGVILYFNYLRYGLTPKTVLRTFLFSVFCFLFSVLFSLPFHLNFTQIAKGVAFVQAHSPLSHLLVLWGYQWIIGLGFLIFLLIKKRITNYELRITDIFVLILLAVATLLIIIPEIIYVKDIYIASYHRANTMFKLVYQSFLLYALASGYIIVRLILNIKYQKSKIFNFYSVFFIFTFLFLIFVMIYPYFAVKSYYGLRNYRGLDGLSYLAKTNPDDFAGIAWLKENVPDQTVVLEAAGDSYTDFNRVSMATGLPTIQGWLVHEWLWRGSFDEPGKRANEVEIIYTSQDLPLTQNLLKKYRVGYVFIGKKEQEKYPVWEEKFNALGSLVFSQSNTKIYSFVKEDNQ